MECECQTWKLLKEDLNNDSFTEKPIKEPMREDITLDLVLYSAQDLFQMLQLKSTVVYLYSTCLCPKRFLSKNH